MHVAGVPFDQGRHPQGPLNPTAGVLHRTYGAKGQDQYAGAYSIGKNGRGGVGIGFHFLIGKKEGQWVQFYDTRIGAAHAKGANSWAIGIEFDGVNEDVLTDWQVRAGAWIIGSVGLPITYYDGRRAKVTGWLNHASVPGSDHTDKVTRADWDRMIAKLDHPTKPNTFRQDLARYVLPYVMGMPDLDTAKADVWMHVVWLQRALNIAAGANLKETGVYDEATIGAVTTFQENVEKIIGHPIGDIHGVAYSFTRFYLVVALQNIIKGA